MEDHKRWGLPLCVRVGFVQLHCLTAFLSVTKLVEIGLLLMHTYIYACVMIRAIIVSYIEYKMLYQSCFCDSVLLDKCWFVGLPLLYDMIFNDIWKLCHVCTKNLQCLGIMCVHA